jgi:hypothetical protein
MLRALPAFILLIALAFSAGCESSTKALPKPTGTTTTVLPTDSRRGTLATQLGLEIRLELPVPEAGHVWTIVQHDPRFLSPLGEISRPSPETGRSTAAFHAIHRGRTQLKFLAVPAHGGPEVLPVDHYELVVAIE